MNVQRATTLLLILGGLVLGGTGRAAAQYGAVPAGTIFQPAQDSRTLGRSPHMPGIQPVSPAEDPYSPEVWTARRRHGGTPAGYAGAPAAYLQESVPAEELLPGGPYPEMPFEYGPGPEFYGHPHHHGPHDPAFGPPPHGCDPCGHHACGSGHCCFPIPTFEAEIFGGVHGFKGPRDNAINGNFGFHEGFNIGAGLGQSQFDLGYQFGWQAVHSNLSGTSYGDLGHDDLGRHARHQYFMTAGVFQRAECGLQWGVAWDWLHDEYIDTLVGVGPLDLFQLRAELALVNVAGHEMGFASAIGLNRDHGVAIAPDEFALVEQQWRGVDQFVGFYRWRFDNCAEARLWAGFTSTRDALLGGDARLPLNDRWSISLNANYLLPEEPRGLEGATFEQWNVAINLHWHAKCAARKRGPYRPLFDVADNGRFMVEPRTNLFREQQANNQ